MTDWYPKRRFGDLPDEMARKFPNREALVFEDERYTFTELKAEIDRAAKALLSLGVERGDHVSLWLNNRSQWVFLMYALAKVGAVQVPVNTRFRTNDLEYVLRQSDSAMLITHDTSGPIDYPGHGAPGGRPAHGGQRGGGRIVAPTRSRGDRRRRRVPRHGVLVGSAPGSGNRFGCRPGVPRGCRGSRRSRIHDVHVRHDRLSPRACSTTIG